MQFKSLKTILDKKTKKTGVSSREFFYFFKNLFKLSNYSAMVLRPIWVEIFFYTLPDHIKNSKRTEF